jgi:hypothetical protein
MSSENNQGTMEQMKDKAKDLADKAQDGINNMKYKAKEIINDTEKKVDDKR